MATATVFSVAPWLAQTKLRPPLPRADSVPRPRLSDAVSAALAAYPVTLISAPAGSGKTTLLAELARLGSEPRLAWLALDEGDDDPALFVQALRAALQQVLPALPFDVPLPGAGEPGLELHRQIGVLINQLLAYDTPVALVLDDLHVINDPAIYSALGLLIERLPPALHLVIATRSDPPLNLPRLRARRRLAEFRLSELRFSVDEAELLLGVAGASRLRGDRLRLLHQRAEGWAAGMTLLASSLDRMPSDSERDAFVDRFEHTAGAVWEYLAEEVLERQDPITRMFLLETSILPELTPAACEAITGRSDAADVLSELYRRNLFLLALDRVDSSAAYRYHDLFAAFLRERLRREHPAWSRELHRRAAAVEAQPGRRVQHLLQAEQWDLAADEVERAGEGLLRQGALATLRGMLESLPAPIRARRPRCTYLEAMCLAGSWQLAEARPLLERAYRELGAAGDVVAQGITLVSLADALRMLGEYGPARDATLAALSLPLPARYRILLLASHAWQLQYDGDWSGQIKALDEMLELLEHSGEPGMLYNLAVGYRMPLIIVPGGVARAERFARIVAAAAPPEGGPLEATLHGIRALCQMLRGRSDLALAHSARAVALSREWGGLPWIEIDVEPLWIMERWLRGDGAAAGELDALLDGYAGAAEAWVSVHLFLRGKLAWLAGDRATLLAIERRIRAAAGPGEWPIAPAYRLKLAALCAIAEQRYAAARELLEQARAAQRKQIGSRIAGDASVLLAHTYLCLEQPADALRVLAPLLEEHERENTPGFLIYEGAPLVVPLLRLAAERDVHAAFTGRVLALLGEPAPAAQRGGRELDGGEALTPREVEVLKLLAAGASNAVIAETLVISLHTAKRHVTNIHAKLGVASRLEAVAVARSLGMV